jgi:hypothetical protein
MCGAWGGPATYSLFSGLIWMPENPVLSVARDETTRHFQQPDVACGRSDLLTPARVLAYR